MDRYVPPGFKGGRYPAHWRRPYQHGRRGGGGGAERRNEGLQHPRGRRAREPRHEKGRQKTIRQIIQNEQVHILDGEAIAIGNLGFAGIKGFGGGFDNYMLSMFGEAPMKAFVQEAVNDALSLDRALTRLDQQHENLRKIALLHYSPI